jgi:hypothetical protein
MSQPENCASTTVESGTKEVPVESLSQLESPSTRLEKILQYVPRALSSKIHVIFLTGLGVYLVLLPLFGVHVSTLGELIGGNYTNVTSDIGACIAAGGTLHLVRQSRKRHLLEQERLKLTQEIHRLLHHVHSEHARKLGQEPC